MLCFSSAAEKSRRSSAQGDGGEEAALVGADVVGGANGRANAHKGRSWEGGERHQGSEESS